MIIVCCSFPSLSAAIKLIICTLATRKGYNPQATSLDIYDKDAGTGIEPLPIEAKNDAKAFGFVRDD